MLSLTQSHQVFFRHPLCLIPSLIIQRLTQSLSSSRSTCPNHLKLLFLIIKLTGIITVDGCMELDERKKDSELGELSIITVD